MPRAGFEPTIPATKQPQTYALDRAATGIGTNLLFTYAFLIRLCIVWVTEKASLNKLKIKWQWFIY
jgi:hypothetical protein